MRSYARNTRRRLRATLCCRVARRANVVRPSDSLKREPERPSALRPAGSRSGSPRLGAPANSNATRSEAFRRTLQEIQCPNRPRNERRSSSQRVEGEAEPLRSQTIQEMRRSLRRDRGRRRSGRVDAMVVPGNRRAPPVRADYRAAGGRPCRTSKSVQSSIAPFRSRVICLLMAPRDVLDGGKARGWLLQSGSTLAIEERRLRKAIRVERLQVTGEAERGLKLGSKRSPSTATWRSLRPSPTGAGRPVIPMIRSHSSSGRSTT